MLLGGNPACSPISSWVLRVLFDRLFAPLKRARVGVRLVLLLAIAGFCIGKHYGVPSSWGVSYISYSPWKDFCSNFFFLASGHCWENIVGLQWAPGTFLNLSLQSFIERVRAAISRFWEPPFSNDSCEVTPEDCIDAFSSFHQVQIVQDSSLLRLAFFFWALPTNGYFAALPESALFPCSISKNLRLKKVRHLVLEKPWNLILLIGHPHQNRWPKRKQGDLRWLALVH
jgi:hypothetical protein